MILNKSEFQIALAFYLSSCFLVLIIADFVYFYDRQNEQRLDNYDLLHTSKI